MSAVVGALDDAWAELRHHKLRVLLSLIGIAVSVAAIAAVLAFGDYIRQSNTEQSERWGGREATVSIGAARTDGAPIDAAAMDAAVHDAAERFSLPYAARKIDQLSTPATIQLSDYVRPVTVSLAEPAFATIHRSSLHAGRWFQEDDAQWLAPPVILSQPLWQALGAPSLATSPTVELTGTLAGTYRIVGVLPQLSPYDTQKQITLLPATYLERVGALSPNDSFTWEIWVDPNRVDEIGPQLAAQLRAAAGTGTDVTVSRSDWGTRPEVQQSAAMFELITGVIAGLVLLLGGLGLVNIQLVAMRQRIREIGVRRSFGATSARIFTTVLLENVVATAVAGIVGIAIAIVVLRVLFSLEVIPPLQETPAFPMRAALVALAASVGIGAVAGFLPALAAVRAKVIDALRF